PSTGESEARMRTSNSTSHNTVLSRLPEWFGNLLGSARAKAHETAAIEDAVVAAVEHEDTTPVTIHNNKAVASVVDEMLSQSRFALLLRPQLIGNLSPEQLARTRTALADGMCLV